MSENRTSSRNEPGWNIEAQIIEQLKAGAKKTTIIEKHISEGMSRPAALQLVDQAYTRYLKTLEQERFNEQFSFAIILPAVAGGFLAALLAGII